MGNCVGKRNYKYFIAFINITTLLICYQVAISLWNLATLAGDYRDADPTISSAKSWQLAMKESPYSMILLIYSFGFSLFLFTLTGYHHYLIFFNETTNENLKKTFRSSGNPFRSYSCWEHWREVCKPHLKRMLWKPKRKAGLPRADDRRELYAIAAGRDL